MSRLNTLTNTVLLPKVVDTVLDSNVFATRMLSRSQKWTGEKIRKAIKVSNSNLGGSFSGMETFSTEQANTREFLEFEAKFYEAPVTVSLTELSKNQADESRVVDLAVQELAERTEEMADAIGNIFYGDGTGNNSKDFLGLEGIVDDGTNLATYGGLARSSFQTLNSTVTASGGTLSLAKLATLHSAITSGSVKPSLGIMDETVWDLFEQLLQPQERITKDISAMSGGKLVGGTGFTALFHRGVPYIADEKATSGTLYLLNERFLEWRALPMAMTTPINFKLDSIEGNDYDNVKGLGFSWTDWITPSNQASIVGHLYLGGQLWSSNPKRHGKLTGITSV